MLFIYIAGVVIGLVLLAGGWVEEDPTELGALDAEADEMVEEMRTTLRAERRAYFVAQCRTRG